MGEHPTPADARRLLEGTTPGPWAVEGSYIMDRYRSQIITLLGDMAEAYPEADEDARLIAAAPALAAALADHEGLQDRVDDLRDQVGRVTRERDEWEANEQEREAEVAALRTQLDVAVRLLGVEHSHNECDAWRDKPTCPVCAFLSAAALNKEEG